MLGNSHGWRSLVGYSPWGHEESDTTERLHFHFSLSHTGEGNGNPLQCSCLENPRDRGAWWAADYGVAQSQTRLKRLSSSSSRASVQFIALILAYQTEWFLTRGSRHNRAQETGDLFCSRNLTFAAAAAKSLQSYPTLCDPIDGSPPASPVPGIFQARTLEWVAISFSNA